MNRSVIFCLIFLLMMTLTQMSDSLRAQKLDGVNLMPVKQEIEADFCDPIKTMEAGWLSLVIYTYGEYKDGKYTPYLGYKQVPQAWGESPEGVCQLSQMASEKGLKVMLKPSVWYPGHGWPGDFYLEKEEEWIEWQDNYRAYLMSFANDAEACGVDLICIATEMKRCIIYRPIFWEQLIEDVRKVFKGKLTYAANWDNYQDIPFWDKLDYIGVDAYFPLSDSRTPSMKDLEKAWSQPHARLEKFSKKKGKSILFTEYGYKSIDQAVWKQWEIENLVGFYQANLQAQVNAYKAIFETFWVEDWFAGGFIWNWQHFHLLAGGTNDDDYTPQNKPAEALIREWYEKFD